jgi:NAD(P)-dependent dehydrogenase (short-subunit alcohol dehydrogenase family)
MLERPFASYPSLKDRAVIVTGGAGGIGEATVRAFAAQGARIGFLDIAETAGKALAEELAGGGAKAAFEPCDLTDIDQLGAALARIAARHGPALVLVNNAANDDRHDWREVTPAYWDGRIEVNLRHMFFAIQAVAPGMIAAGGGSIVNFGSIAWMIAGPGYPIYATAKAAVHGMTRSFARELGKDNIRVNTVAPGWVMTERQKTLWLDEEAERTIDREQCLAGRIQPEDVASMALFLAAEDSCMCTAQTFIVDGGWA